VTSFAQPIVICCPGCQSHLYKRRLASFNDFGAKGWSDGYSSIWALEQVPGLGRCPQCGRVFWTADAEELGILPKEAEPIGSFSRFLYRIFGDNDGRLGREKIWNETPAEWKGAKTVERPDLDGFQHALKDETSLNSEREALLRRGIWHEGNDHLRLNMKGQPFRDTPCLSPVAVQENLEALLVLIDEGVHTFPTERGEILRQLGHFDEAIAELKLVEGELKAQAELMIGFAKSGDSVVREVWRSEFDY
jgi:hypothetical protein